MKGSRDDWKGPFYLGHLPAWICPTCHRGTLIEVPKSFSETRTPMSREAWDLHGEPEMIVCEFNLLMRCSRRECEQEVRVVGRTSTTEDENYQSANGMDRKYDELLHPVLVYPAPPIIDLPSDCPEGVRNQIQRSFLLMWQDPSAAGNRLRVAVEELMDHLHVPKTQITKKGKRIRSKLHDRLIAYKGSDKMALSWDMGERLLAVKCLGNAGSHVEELTPDEVLSAYDFLEAVLPRICGDKDRRQSRLAAAINKRGGPIRPRKRKGK